jgi:hypothetical protein
MGMGTVGTRVRMTNLPKVVRSFAVNMAAGNAGWFWCGQFQIIRLSYI